MTERDAWLPGSRAAALPSSLPAAPRTATQQGPPRRVHLALLWGGWKQGDAQATVVLTQDLPGLWSQPAALKHPFPAPHWAGPLPSGWLPSPRIGGTTFAGTCFLLLL